MPASRRNSGEIDSAMMSRAIRLARRAEGRVEPNPMVGCVLVRNGEVLAEGYHRRFGGPHAELDAIRRCAGHARGSILYVSLEPCCHFGKTPPCVDALIAAGIREVVAPLADPNPQVRGRGFERLRSAGIAVRTGVEPDQAAALLSPFATRVLLGRPYVIAKWAQDADGWMTTPAGRSPWISCTASRRRVHQMRARVDAIVVGIGTVMRDDPRLTARSVVVRRRAARVVFDSRLRIPLSSRLVRSPEAAPLWVFSTEAAARTRKAQRLRASGVEVMGIKAATDDGRPDVGLALRELAALGATNVLVEGGPCLLRSFFEAGVVDEIRMFVAPCRFAGRIQSRRSGRHNLADFLEGCSPFSVSKKRSGVDLLHTIRLQDPLRFWRAIDDCPFASD
jgi:diaminohydroxyphosphoribosylaminopyrimidine deaminase/5-amino-6-(5-phosphoribosylamino)uracil reductase